MIEVHEQGCAVNHQRTLEDTNLDKEIFTKTKGSKREGQPCIE